MDCRICSVKKKCLCHKCINFYTRDTNYKGGDCLKSAMRSGCYNFNRGRLKEDDCVVYAEIDWIYEVKFYKQLKIGRKKLKGLMGG